MRVLGDGGAHALFAFAAAVARVLDAGIHEGIHINQLLAGADGGLLQPFFTVFPLRAQI